VVPRGAVERHFPQGHASIATEQLRDQMAAIMSLDEPRPRGTVLGERADWRPVREVEHFFRCKATTVGSMRGITYGPRITKARCRISR
jgi:hypothetical protein